MTRRSAVLTLLLAGDLATWAGCGSSGPPTGTAASPVDEKEAAAQRQATEEGYKAMMKKARKR